jgi:hypothetical protein
LTAKRPPGLSAEGLAQHGVLVRPEVDHAVGDQDIGRVIGQGDLLDRALQEPDVLGAGLLPVALGRREHLVGHV